MHLSVYSIKKVLFEGEAESINCKTVNGEITILDQHRPLITELAPGTIKIIDSQDKENYFLITTGFVEVQTHNRARIIVNE